MGRLLSRAGNQVPQDLICSLTPLFAFYKQLIEKEQLCFAFPSVNCVQDWSLKQNSF